MKILMRYTKRGDQLSSKYTYSYDSWGRKVKKTENKFAEGLDYCGKVKTSHKVVFG